MSTQAGRHGRPADLRWLLSGGGQPFPGGPRRRGAERGSGPGSAGAVLEDGGGGEDERARVVEGVAARLAPLLVHRVRVPRHLRQRAAAAPSRHPPTQSGGPINDPRMRPCCTSDSCCARAYRGTSFESQAPRGLRCRKRGTVRMRATLRS